MYQLFVSMALFAASSMPQTDQNSPGYNQGGGASSSDQRSSSEVDQGETARSTVGQVGERQTPEQLGRDAGIEPMARITSRIQNRVQSRIRNRIDRYYDPQANATSPFDVAGNQARTAGRRPQ
jgi:hypothetical protein